MKKINFKSLIKSRKFLFVFVFVFTYSLIHLFAYSVAKAQDVLPLTVVPPKQEVLVNPGEKFNTTVKYLNQSDSPVNGTISVLDFIVQDDKGTPVFLDNPTIVGTTTISAKYSAAKWISFPTENITIAANGNTAVPVTINVPKIAAPGGRYAAILFQPTLNSVEKGNEGTAITPTAIRLASLIYIRVAGPIIDKASVTNFTGNKFSEYGPIDISTEIANGGTYHITPKGYITMTDIFGREVATSALETKNIFPGTQRQYTNKLGEKWMLGKFTVKLAATYGDANSKVLASSFVLWIFPWKVALAILLAIVIITLVIILTYKKMNKKEEVLEKELKEEKTELEALKAKFKDQLPPTDSTPPSDKTTK